MFEINKLWAQGTCIPSAKCHFILFPVWVDCLAGYCVWPPFDFRDLSSEKITYLLLKYWWYCLGSYQRTFDRMCLSPKWTGIKINETIRGYTRLLTNHHSNKRMMIICPNTTQVYVPSVYSPNRDMKYWWWAGFPADAERLFQFTLKQNTMIGNLASQIIGKWEISAKKTYA